ncbi:MAG: ABC transporter permease, partial [Pirellulales bacterium]|nr:ABC transporter permease [Pirellulales bacterium]
MSETAETRPAAALGKLPKSPGFWSEAWIRFRRRKMAMLALGYVVLLMLIALLAPLIVGTKPIVCSYKGELYFPAMGYYSRGWEAAIFFDDGLIGNYPQGLVENDPESWAIWPLVYKDPYRRIRDNEVPGQPGDPFGPAGKP